MREPIWSPPNSLEQRFYQFVETLPRAEIVDHLVLTPEQQRAEKADIFFESRSFVGELKSLAKDTSTKIEPIVGPYREDESWPLFYGSRPMGDILAKLPNGDQLRKTVYEEISSAIPELVRKANRQIRVTKRMFGLPDAKGILVIINDLVDILTPEIVAHRVAATLMKRNPDTSLQFPEISGVWIIGERHTVQLTPSLKGIPAVVLLHPALEKDGQTDQFLSFIQGLWSTFNGLPLVRIESRDFHRLKYERLVDHDEEQSQTLSEYWRKEYHARPYLRSLTNDQLFEYGAKLGAESGRMFLKGSRSRHGERMRSGRRFGEFVEELNHRNLDLRELGPYNQSMSIFFPDQVVSEADERADD